MLSEHLSTGNESVSCVRCLSPTDILLRNNIASTAPSMEGSIECRDTETLSLSIPVFLHPLTAIVSVLVTVRIPD